ncbi:hypothetical protein [Paraliobacillus sp. JSM ZJ581]|uniref:hypothetical protein n=1 Tax=Paraliobacillus sp. JSM ZJ581 TaxID=3342118 RepID=UPI0035A87F1C
MKAKTYKIIIGLFSLILLASCGSEDKMNFYEQTSDTELKEELNAIKIGSTELEVKEAFGEPNSTEETKNSMYLKYGSQEYKYAQFQIVNGIVKRYFFSDKQYNKNKKVGIGSSKQTIITEYGENYYIRDDSSDKVLGYFDKDKGINIEFAFEDSKVIGIEVSKVNK